jgi:hypothetical protein
MLVIKNDGSLSVVIVIESESNRIGQLRGQLSKVVGEKKKKISR